MDSGGKIIGALAVTAIFAIVGEYNRPDTTKKPDPARVIIGASIAAGILVGISEFGSAGEQFALGLAVLAMVTAVFVEGAPVWNVINGAVKGSPTTPITTATTPTTPKA